MRTDFWRASKLLLAQLLKLDINEQLVREVDYLMAENQVLKNQITKYTTQFDEIIKSAGIKPIKLPAMSPNLNAYAERWVKSVKNEIIDRQVLFGKKALSHAMKEYIAHFHHERNHQGLDNTIPFPAGTVGNVSGKISRKERLGGLLKYYYRQAA